MRSLVTIFVTLLTGWTVQAGVVRIECKVTGLPVNGDRYQTLVEGRFQITTDDIKSGPVDPEEQGCIPGGQASKLFGLNGGTRLQISALRCGEHRYFTQKVIVNGVPVVAELSTPNSRVSFNNDADATALQFVNPAPFEHLRADAPIATAEGTFRFIYSDCEMR